MYENAARTARRIGVCSWSTLAGSPTELAERVRSVGVSNVQLALEPLRSGSWTIEATRAALHGAGVEIRSGMMGMQGEDYSTLESIRRTGGVRPDATWSANLAAARDHARLAPRLGIRLVTFHAGFLPHERGDRERAVMLERLRTLVDVFAAEGVRVGFETGQESAATLAGVLAELDRPAAGVNFDPANMLLYGMGDPVAALAELAPRVVQIHVKDATRSRLAGSWGTEVRAGTGEVDWKRFFGVLAEAGLEIDLMIEREGDSDRVPDRIGDMRAARELCERMLAGAGAT